MKKLVRLKAVLISSTTATLALLGGVAFGAQATPIGSAFPPDCIRLNTATETHGILWGDNGPRLRNGLHHGSSSIVGSDTGSGSTPTLERHHNGLQDGTGPHHEENLGQGMGTGPRDGSGAGGGRGMGNGMHDGTGPRSQTGDCDGTGMHRNI